MSRKIKYKLEGKSGIYKITNTINNKFYIGSSIKLQTRLINHFSSLKKGYHKNLHLQSSYNKYGDVFAFEILEYCSKELLISKEQYYIDRLKPHYNILEKAYSPQGYKHTEEFKKKASLRMRDRIKQGSLSVHLSAAKLTEDIVKSIVNDIKSLNNTKNIIKKYNITRSTFHSILQGKTWKHITQNLSKEDIIKHKEFNKKCRLPYLSRIPIEKIQGIKECYLKGDKITHIAKKFNVCRDTVYDIIK